MTSSLRVIESDVENRFACAEIPLAGPSQNSLVNPAAQSGQTVQIKRREHFTEQSIASFLEVAPDAELVWPEILRDAADGKLLKDEDL